MQQATTTAAKTNPTVKNYKVWVMKAEKAAKQAATTGASKETFPAYIAAHNIAKTLFSQLNKVCVLLLIILSLNSSTFAQNATQDAQGNFTAISKATTSAEDKNTGKTFTDREGKKYPVMISKNGKLYYVRTSKTGNTYKAYIKI